MVMNDIRIDRLSLRLSGVHGVDGRQLAELVGQGLAAAGIPAEESITTDSIRIGISARQGEPAPRLAERIVREILRQLGSAG